MLLEDKNARAPRKQCWVRAVHDHSFHANCEVLIVFVDAEGLANLGSVSGLFDTARQVHNEIEPYGERARATKLAVGELRMYRNPKKSDGGFLNVLAVGDDGILPIENLLRDALALANADDYCEVPFGDANPWRRKVVVVPPRPSSTGGLRLRQRELPGPGKALIDSIASGIVRFFESIPVGRLRVAEIDVVAWDSPYIEALQTHKLFR